MATQFARLSLAWNAEPNAPEPRVEIVEGGLRLSFVLDHHLHDFEEEAVGALVFAGCWRYRLGPTNDEGWYRGQCRFSQIAPAWGEFYEVTGDLKDGGLTDWHVLGVPSAQARHFLFYLRDQTFECDAEGWSLELPPRG